MIFSRSAEYAIRAFVHLARVPEGKYAMVKDIARDSGIPSHFLAKILQQMARKGFLKSSKGPTGGFCLREPAEEISMLKIVESQDGLSDFERCPAGMAKCDDHQPCGMHDKWKALRQGIMDYLGQTSIADLALALDQKQKALGKPKRVRRSAPAKN